MTSSGKLDAFLKMLERGQDGPLLRYSIGLEYLHAEDPSQAAEHLTQCIELDPDYSAAYKCLAQAQDALGETEACRSTLEKGIAAAERKGDIQAQKEMKVFQKRLDKGKPLKSS